VAAPIRVLSIDGGGIRGIIPATILVELERRLAPRAIADVFDLVVGTSTGGILALGLSVPEGGRPRHSAEELLDLYVSEARTIFPDGGSASLTERVFGVPDRTAWFRDPIELLLRRSARQKERGSSRYALAGLDSVLGRYIGDARLADALVDVVVTSYDMAYHEPVIFSIRPRAGFVTDVSMRVAARATSAGPTFFDPQEIVTDERRRVLVDGGVYVNNPSILGYLLGGQAAARAAAGLVLVSLGTGTRPPREPSTAAELEAESPLLARALLEAVASGSGSMGDALLRGLADGERFRYWRVQTDVGACSFSMDDSRPENVACLAARGRELAGAARADLDAIAGAVEG
jgi:patatin-like phospholipase/acyl hydrolase